MGAQPQASTASRRTFVGLGGAVLAAALSASATGATPPGLPAVAAPGEALAETRDRNLRSDMSANFVPLCIGMKTGRAIYPVTV